MLITILQRRGCWQFTMSGGDAGYMRALATGMPG